MKQEQIRLFDEEAHSELRAICIDIAERQWNEDTWSAHESDDEFQTEHLCGGFDATEREFCFSYYSSDGREYWFQFPLSEAKMLASSEDAPLRLREAE